MLYGFKEVLDDRISTIVTAADKVEDYDLWVGNVTAELNSPDSHYEDFYTSTFLDHMYREEFKGYKRPVLAFFHTDEAQRDAFVQKWNIKEVTPANSRDRQKDMIWRTKRDEQAKADAAEEAAAEAEGREVIGRSIEELYGLDKEDPWDKRTEEEKEADVKMKEEIKKLRKEGKISGDSFGGAQAQRDAREADRAAAEGRAPATPDTGAVRVTDIRGETNDDGTFDINSVLARKFGGEIDVEAGAAAQAAHEEQVAKQLAGRKVFDPEDFAAVLRGDGSADHLNVKGDKGTEKKRAPVARPSLSDHAEAARKEYQEEQKRVAKEAAAKQKIIDDKKALEEREQNIFRGADLGGEEEIAVADLPEKIRAAIERMDPELKVLPLKDYPYNAELAGRVLLPSEGDYGAIPEDRYRSSVVMMDNLRVDGTISMGHPVVIVATKEDLEKPGWAVYQNLRKLREDELADPVVEKIEPEDSTESVKDVAVPAATVEPKVKSPYKNDIYVVRIR